MGLHGRKGAPALLMVVALGFLAGSHSARLCHANANRSVADCRLLVMGRFPSSEDSPNAAPANVTTFRLHRQTDCGRAGTGCAPED